MYGNQSRNNRRKHYDRQGREYTEERGKWQGNKYYSRNYKDGSSNTWFGGPCGPIYTDRDGNM